jgi:hypothetical protein
MKPWETWMQSMPVLGSMAQVVTTTILRGRSDTAAPPRGGSDSRQRFQASADTARPRGALSFRETGGPRPVIDPRHREVQVKVHYRLSAARLLGVASIVAAPMMVLFGWWMLAVGVLLGMTAAVVAPRPESRGHPRRLRRTLNRVHVRINPHLWRPRF